jgi:chromosome segregation ATPase
VKPGEGPSLAPAEKIAALEAEVADYRGQLDYARDLIDSARAAAHEMEAMIESARQAAAEMEASIRSARSVIDQKETELGRARENHALQAATIERLERDLATTQEALIEALRDGAQETGLRGPGHDVLQGLLREWQHRATRREHDLAVARRTIARLARARLGARTLP